MSDNSRTESSAGTGVAEVLTPDICVIGGGPAGIAAALAAVAEGVSVTLVERGRTGGSDLPFGTLPSKALLAAADVYEALRTGPAVGVTGAPLQINLPKVREHIDAVAVSIAPRFSRERLTALGVRIVSGSARFSDRRTLSVGDTIIRPRHTVLAVGSVPTVPAIPGIDGIDFMTPRTGIFDLARKPAHLLVLGAGPYALELAQAHNRLGIDATVISSGPALPEADPELAGIIVNRLRAEGIRIRANVKVYSVSRRKGGIRFSVDDPEEESAGGALTVDGTHLLVIDGRRPDVDELNLSAAGVAFDQHGIAVDSRFRTTNHAVYAIGDATPGQASVARAEYQASRVVKSLASRLPLPVDPLGAPFVAFTDPALASVGLGEEEARKRFGEIRVVRLSFADNERAQIERLAAGMLKVIALPSGRIVGTAIAARGAAELIAPWSLAIANRLPLSAMAAPWAATPSRSAIAHGLAMLPEARLTPSLRQRIMGFFGKSG
jgi:pyruvate/2-oxoglutarate dehydrogenase complex dihydrolipoamide dehydrogenase (E3) component